MHDDEEGGRRQGRAVQCSAARPSSAAAVTDSPAAPRRQLATVSCPRGGRDLKVLLARLALTTARRPGRRSSSPLALTAQQHSVRIPHPLRSDTHTRRDRIIISLLLIPRLLLGFFSFPPPQREKKSSGKKSRQRPRQTVDGWD
ncbi:hypothetical protein chiPu_0027457 [Chiloscyllium punctatum]|uniref:Uncharacterized protein n=1 Tax=Chiloscyllium punctatum TaxID=137246 RepID=A0A401TL92_CHIPU|nr:hypothetical protein [Chiloscyllium punctatum]